MLPDVKVEIFIIPTKHFTPRNPFVNVNLTNQGFLNDWHIFFNITPAYAHYPGFTRKKLGIPFI